MLGSECLGRSDEDSLNMRTAKSVFCTNAKRWNLCKYLRASETQR